METHRRTFLTSRGIAVCLAGGQALGRPVDVPLGDGREPGARYTEIDLIAGTMHYWRLDPADWRPCLTAMKQLGLHLVDTAIPWGVHERRPGKHDWSKERDLAAFLDQVGRAGMYAIVRPGPLAGGELSHAGLPARLLDRREILALSARGIPVCLPAAPRMFPLPSHAAAGFQEEVAAWYAAVGEILTPRLAPQGPVVAVHVGHEAQMLARLGPFEHDYHPDALAWWHELGLGQPPRAWDPDDAARCAAWIQFRETYLARTLGWLGSALDQAGVRGIVRLHDLPGADPGLAGLPGLPVVQAALEEAAPGDGPSTGMSASMGAGMSVGHRAVDHETSRRRALYLTGSADPLPYAPEVAVGGPAWGVPAAAPDAEHAGQRRGRRIDQQSALLSLLAAGVRGFGLSMAVERDRWYGAPISEVGELDASAVWLQRLLAALADVAWTALRRHAPVAVIASRADARFALASSAAGPIWPLIEALLGPRLRHGAALGSDAGAMAQRRWMEATERALALAQVPYLIVDETCPLERLARFRVMVMPTIDRVSRATWQRLHALADRGVVVIVGPGRPSRDEHDRPLGSDAALPANAGLIRKESAGDLDALADDLAGVLDRLADEDAGLANVLSDLWIAAEQPDVDCSLFVNRAGAPRILFAGNRGHQDVTADILVPQGTALFDPLADEELLAGHDGTADVALAPQQVRMFLID